MAWHDVNCVVCGKNLSDHSHYEALNCLEWVSYDSANKFFHHVSIDCKDHVVEYHFCKGEGCSVKIHDSHRDYCSDCIEKAGD